ncbi:MAG: type II toxin-antitoxin system Phd/YefM family antitoxin [Burkholderiaceae bacterium]
MQTISMRQARSALARLVEAIEQGRARAIIIARNGRPAARLVLLETSPVGQRIGVAKNKFEVPGTIDTRSEERARLFTAERDLEPA